MKKQLIVISLAALVLSLTACNKGKVKELETKNQELSQINQLQDSLLNDFMLYFNEFEDNLEMIKEREAIISVNTVDPEFNEDRKNLVIEDIQLINSLLVQNQSIIDSLNQRLEGNSGKFREFRRTISRLNKQLDSKTTQVATLKENLETMNFTVASLNTQVDTLTFVSKSLRNRTRAQEATITDQTSLIAEQSDQIDHQTKALNTAYYITGTSKELKEKQILSKEGGLMGIGAAKKLNEDFDRSAFTEIDITEIQNIPVDSKKAKILTNHPSGSFVLKNNENEKIISGLEITNPENFWSTSKFLVVVTN